jgi:hypothetical protein
MLPMEPMESEDDSVNALVCPDDDPMDPGDEFDDMDMEPPLPLPFP